ncbi:MAG: membrane protein insertase YidC [Acidobacteria bacterium]|nr:membrane protein insertase YidC [Acidobacteriota bacterium]
MLIGFNLLFQKTSPPLTEPSPKTAAPRTSPSTPEQPPAVSPESGPADEPTAIVPPPPPVSDTEPAAETTLESAPVTQASPETITIDTRLYTARLDNRGGILRNFILKEYSEESADPLDLVPHDLPDDFPSFLSLAIPDDAEMEKEVNSVHYEIIENETETALGKVRRVQFLYQRSGLLVEKVISFLLSKPYQLQISCRVMAGDLPMDAYLRLGPGLTNHNLVPTDGNMLPPHAVYLEGNSADTLMGPDVAEEKDGMRTITGPLRWAGVQTKFFAAVAIPYRPFPAVEVVNRVWLKQPEATDELAMPDPVTVHIVSLICPAPPETPLTLYLGPKSYRILSAMGLELTQVIDYGWFSFLVKPLYYALLWVNSFIPNWGWSIIVLTFFITVVVFPLRYMQMKSMKKMQNLQPQIKAIQQKYKGQKSAEARQKMNQEVMGLYKEHGVNPMGGCLPLIIQFPFLIAFYRMIELSIEFWHQPWIFWINDLSSKDPYYVTPILMGATMIIQMKQTPAAPGQDNKMQKQMMYLMPVVFTFIFLNLSSGVVIYFLFSNVFSWGLQKLVEHVLPSFRKSVNNRGKKAAAKPSTKKKS